MFNTRDAYLQAVAKATRAAELYYNNTGTSPLSDRAYDDLLEEIQKTGELHGWHEGDTLQEVSAGQVVKREVAHVPPMLSLQKIKELDDVLAFVSKHRGDVVLEPKMDGIAIAVRYEQGRIKQVSTRGDGQAGEDITSQLLTCVLHNLPRELPAGAPDFEVRGELYVDLKHFQELQTYRTSQGKGMFANHRNVITGVLRSFDDASHVNLSFAAYDALGGEFRQAAYRGRMRALEPYGFRPAYKQKLLLDEEKTIRQRIVEFGEVRARLRIPTDGIVIKINSMDLRVELGNANAHPRWAVAYKYEAEATTTKVVDVIRKIGRTGRVSYVASFKPVLLAGSRVSRATLNNGDFIAALDLRIGDTVHLRKANDIIPEIMSVDLTQPRGTTRYVPPNTCPTCGVPFDKSGVNWVCHTPACSKAAKLVYALSKTALDAEGWSDGVVEAFYGAHARELDGFYRLTVNQIADAHMTGDTLDDDGNFRIIRVGEKRAAKLHASLQETKTRPLHRLITALAIPGLGPVTARKIVQSYRSMDRILQLTAANLTRIEGISDISARNILTGLQQNAHLIDRLKHVGFTALAAAAAAESEPAAQPLANNSFVITGSVDGYTRDQIADIIFSLGGQVSSAPSKKTSMVLYGENAGSKLARAQELGVPTFLITDFLASYAPKGGTA